MSNTEPAGAEEPRKSVRNTRLKAKVLQAAAKKDPVQGRRSIFKKTFPQRAPLTSSNQTTTSESLFYQGTYFQVGDIVSLMDENDDVYYAQIRGLIQDSFCEKSAVITWLLPTTSSPQSGFDPATYTIGPEEDQPRRLSSMLFVMHAPSNYFHDKTNPYPPPDVLQEGNRLDSYCGFIWTNLRKTPAE